MSYEDKMFQQMTNKYLKGALKQFFSKYTPYDDTPEMGLLRQCCEDNSLQVVSLNGASSAISEMEGLSLYRMEARIHCRNGEGVVSEFKVVLDRTWNGSAHRSAVNSFKAFIDGNEITEKLDFYEDTICRALQSEFMDFDIRQVNQDAAALQGAVFSRSTTYFN